MSVAAALGLAPALTKRASLEERVLALGLKPLDPRAVAAFKRDCVRRRQTARPVAGKLRFLLLPPVAHLKLTAFALFAVAVGLCVIGQTGLALFPALLIAASGIIRLAAEGSGALADAAAHWRVAAVEDFRLVMPGTVERDVATARGGGLTVKVEAFFGDPFVFAEEGFLCFKRRTYFGHFNSDFGDANFPS